MCSTHLLWRHLIDTIDDGQLYALIVTSSSMCCHFGSCPADRQYCLLGQLEQLEQLAR